MTAPKMLPCPCCDSADYLAVYTYASGWRYVECEGPTCWYRGGGDGSIRGAIKLHNAQRGPRRASVVLSRIELVGGVPLAASGAAQLYGDPC